MSRSKPSLTAVEAAWIDGFGKGVQHALADVVPLVQTNQQVTRTTLQDQAIDQALARLEPLIEQRIQQAGELHLAEVNTILAKQRELELSLPKLSPAERQSAQAVLAFIQWMLNGH